MPASRRRCAPPSRAARSPTRCAATSRSRSTRRWDRELVAEFEDGQEGLLRDLDAADLLHPLLALALALEQLALARDVAAVALGRHVLAEGLDGLAGDDLRADGGLDRHVVLLARDLLAQALGEHLALVVSLVAVDDHAERVDRV